ncbi:hypothetical protein BJ085DRAFT_34936 [Dimargaris cristalligena]|uniref:Uncharacterized protein n=1 Tax=Dimargaris cristalligena TaxID=215637 RepID=A0A4P9ZP15_9FUNG|nr:hypothetical protein BJ085DRAFT_34936 [Dimargaris cristalligena]|eukprot:RKP35053.1 hypothetical protein BJ085DRAFT_34936 [Dimargaris cristalligena]
MYSLAATGDDGSIHLLRIGSHAEVCPLNGKFLRTAGSHRKLRSPFLGSHRTTPVIGPFGRFLIVDYLHCGGSPSPGIPTHRLSSSFMKLLATGMALGGGGSGGGGGSSALAAIAATKKLRLRPRPRLAFADHEYCITTLQLAENPYPMIICGTRNGVIRIFM